MNLLSFIKFAVLSATFINALDAYKILGVFPSMYKSHTIIGEALMTGLAKSGHEVTVVTGFPYTKNTKNYTHIDISDIYKSESGKSFANNFSNYLRLWLFEFKETLKIYWT